MFSFQLIKLNASLCAVAEGGGAGRAGEGREQSLHKGPILGGAGNTHSPQG